jgi:WD40 repeat protein
MAKLGPDGRTLFMKDRFYSEPGAQAGVAEFCDFPTGKPLGSPLRIQGYFYEALFSPNSKSLLTVCQPVGHPTHEGRLWLARRGKPIGKPFPLQLPRRFSSPVFSPNGKILAFHGIDNTTRMMDTTTGQPFGKPLPGTTGPLVFSPDNQKLLIFTRYNDLKGEIRAWDAATGKPLGEPCVLGGELAAVAISPDGKTIITSSGVTNRYNSIETSVDRFFDLASGRPIGKPLHGRMTSLFSFSPSGRTVLRLSHSPSGQRVAYLWTVPVPVPGTAERITLWTQVITGLELDQDGVVHTLDAAAWQKRRQRLEELGGPPIP